MGCLVSGSQNMQRAAATNCTRSSVPWVGMQWKDMWAPPHHPIWGDHSILSAADKGNCTVQGTRHWPHSHSTHNLLCQLPGLIAAPYDCSYSSQGKSETLTGKGEGSSWHHTAFPLPSPQVLWNQKCYLLWLWRRSCSILSQGHIKDDLFLMAIREQWCCALVCFIRLMGTLLFGE